MDHDRPAYDEIADWYEHEFLGVPSLHLDGPRLDPIGIYDSLTQLLGSGETLCVEIGCGTGVYGRWLRRRGWDPLGFDVSSGMLRYAAPRLPVARADATHLPLGTATVDAAVGIMVHTDMPSYPAVIGEVARVLRPGGVYVHVGVHPCFCGGFADRTDPEAIVIAPGYVDGHWTKASYTDRGVRNRVGATHFPLPDLLNAFLAADLTFEESPKAAGRLRPSSPCASASPSTESRRATARCRLVPPRRPLNTDRPDGQNPSRLRHLECGADQVRLFVGPDRVGAVRGSRPGDWIGV